DPVRTNRALRDDALALPEEVGQLPRIGNLDFLLCVGNGEAHRLSAVPHQGPLFYKAANPKPLAGLWRFLRKLARSVKKHDIVAKSEEHKTQCEAERANGRRKHQKAAFLACHGTVSLRARVRVRAHQAARWRSDRPQDCASHL